jgi:hypothetical protein
MIHSKEHDGESSLHPENVLRRELHDFRVGAGAEFFLSPERSDCRDFFASMEVRSMKDLQTLGLVPREIPEQELRQAIAADDETALETARETLLRTPAHPCSCIAKEGDGAQPYARVLKQAYVRARRMYNPALAQLMSRHQRASLAWDSVAVASVRGWASRMEKTAFQPRVIAALFQDITVEKDATLVLDPDTSILFGRSIRIHKTGRIVHRGGYLRIWASEIVQFIGSTTLHADRPIPWRVS